MENQFTLSPEQKFEALIIRYQDHVELLRMMTKIDLQIFGGLLSIQLTLGSFLSINPPKTLAAMAGILLVDAVLSTIASILLRNNALRRKEAVGTLKNVMSALGYYQIGVYIPDKAINESGKLRLWAPLYITGIIISYIGLGVVILSAYCNS